MASIVFSGWQLILEQHNCKFTNDADTLVIFGNGNHFSNRFMQDLNFNNLTHSKNVVVVSLLFKEYCTGIESACNELAIYLNNYGNAYKHIVLVGMSACGVMFYNVLNKISQDVLNTTKFTVISIAAPFRGCIWANRKYVLERLGPIGKLIYNKFFPYKYYVIKDLEKSSPFMRHFSPNVEQLSRKFVLVNVECQAPSLWNAFLRYNLRDIAFAFLSKHRIIRNLGVNDGIVTRSSQHLPSVKNWHAIRTTHISSIGDALEIVMQYIA